MLKKIPMPYRQELKRVLISVENMMKNGFVKVMVLLVGVLSYAVPANALPKKCKGKFCFEITSAKVEGKTAHLSWKADCKTGNIEFIIWDNSGKTLTKKVSLKGKGGVSMNMKEKVHKYSVEATCVVKNNKKTIKLGGSFVPPKKNK